MNNRPWHSYLLVYQKIFLKKGQDSPWHNSPWGPPDFGKRSGHFKTSYHHSTFTSPDIGVHNNNQISSESKKSFKKHQTDSHSNTGNVGYHHFWFGNPSFANNIDPLALNDKETLPASQISLEDPKDSKVSGKKGPETQDQTIEARSPASSSSSLFSDPALQSELVELTKRLNMILLKTPQRAGPQSEDDNKRSETDTVSRQIPHNSDEHSKINLVPPKKRLSEYDSSTGNEENRTSNLFLREPAMNHSYQKTPVKLPNNTQPEKNRSQQMRDLEIPREIHPVVGLPERSNKPKLGHIFRSGDSI